MTTTTDAVPATFRRARPSDLAGLAAGARMDLSAVLSLAAEDNLHHVVRRYLHHHPHTTTRGGGRGAGAGQGMSGFEARRILENKADPVPGHNLRRQQLLDLRRRGW